MSHAKEKLQYISEILHMTTLQTCPVQRVFYYHILQELFFEYFECDYPTLDFNLDLQKLVNVSLSELFAEFSQMAYDTLSEIHNAAKVHIVSSPEGQSMLSELAGSAPSAKKMSLDDMRSGELYCFLDQAVYLADGLLHYDNAPGIEHVIYLLNLSHFIEPNINLVKVFRKRKKSTLTNLEDIRDYYDRQSTEEMITVCLQSSDCPNHVMAIKKLTVDPVIFTDWGRLHDVLAPIFDVEHGSYVRQTTSLHETPYDDHLLNFPFYSYDHLIDFMRTLITEGGIREIVWTIYRLVDKGAMFQLFNEILQAGIGLTLVIEVRAKYEELDNIKLVNYFKSLGVNIHVSHLNDKHHAKWALVKFADSSKKDIAMIGTGNWNEKHAKQYNDLLLITRHPGIVQDISMLFDILKKELLVDEAQLSALWISKINFEHLFFDKINKLIAEAQSGRKAFIFLKLNDLTYKPLVSKLQEAAAKGVTIELCIRRVVTIYSQPNLTVYRYLGPLLEHSRILYFLVEGSEPDIYIGSGNMNAANFLRRYEVYVPIYEERLKRRMMLIVNTYRNTQFSRIELMGLDQSQITEGIPIHTWMLDNYKDFR